MPDLRAILLDAPRGHAVSKVQIAKLGSFDGGDRYGPFSITRDDIQQWGESLKLLPGQRALVDLDHSADRSPRRSEAAGWITAVDMQDGVPTATIEWTKVGKRAIEDGRYLFFSPSYGPWSDESGTEHPNVLVGGALTNRPFLNMPQIRLAQAERVELAEHARKLLDTGEADRDEDWKARRKQLKQRARKLDVNPGALGFGGKKKAKKKRMDAPPVPVRTLEQQAADNGLVVLDQAEHYRLQQAAVDRDRDRFTVAFDNAVRARKVSPGERQGLQRLYTLDAVTTLESIAMRQPIMPEGPTGEPAIEFDPYDPDLFENRTDEYRAAGFEPASVMLDQRVRQRMRDRNLDYATALTDLMTGNPT